MPTTQPKRPLPLGRPADRDPQVYHPLDQLRGIIRRYVVIEAVLSAILFLALWFTIGLALDYGVFKTAGWDWVRDGSWWLRLVALVVAVALFVSLLVVRLARRLTTEFSYPSLALVLERKFPRVLGDRLITAVEMADVEAMGKFGYSTDMIRVTIAEARERVAKVPVREVFNWKRLWVLGFVTIGLLVGTLVFSFVSYAIATSSADVYRFGWKFAHVTGIFAERNVALMNTPWPRRAHLELVGFPPDELTVGRDAPPPRVTARAYRWVIADRHAPEGWRPLVWSDVTPELVGRKVPALPPALLSATAWDGGDPTVDAVERVARETEDEVTPEVAATRTRIKSQMNRYIEADGLRTATLDYEAMQEVFRELAVRADEPSMGRTLRRLDLPDEVTYKFAGRKTGGSGTLSPQQNNEFAGEISGLKEDVEFVVRGADFESSPRRIRLIPPPSLKRLGREQAEPAYLHHAPPADGGYNALEGLLQKVEAKDLSLTGDRTILVVPSGTELTIHAEAYTADNGELSDNDRIISAHAIPVTGRFPGTVYDDKGKPTQDPVPLPLSNDGAGFTIGFTETMAQLPRKLAAGSDFVGAGFVSAFAALKKHTDFRLTDNVEFKLVFTNKYKVSSTRSVLIQVVKDQAPVVEVSVEGLRRSGNVYLVTPKARIPFNPDSFVKDDHGLSKVEYTYSYYAEDSDVVRSIRAKLALRALLNTPLPGARTPVLLSLGFADNFRTIDKSDASSAGSVFMSQFLDAQGKLRTDSLARLKEQLPIPRAEEPPPAVLKIELKDTNRDYFDLDVRYPPEHSKAGQRVFDLLARPDEVQPIYRMDLNVQATDNNVDAEGGPKIARNAEPIRLRIVSEGDLLLEIGREEEQLATKLDEALLKLAAAKKKYEFVRNTNGYKEESPTQVDAVKVRSQDAYGDVEKARDIVQNVGREYRRLTRECEINRVNAVALDHYIKFSATIEAIVGEDPQVPITFAKTQALLGVVQNALNVGRWAALVNVSDAENSLYALERRLQQIRDEHGEGDNYKNLQKAIAAIKERQARIRKEIKDWQDDENDKRNSKEPSVGLVGLIALNKGETKKLQHTIAWNQYEKDDLIVKISSSDPSLTVLAELKLDFEKNQFRFEYEIKAGQKAGDYTVTLTPAVGKAVVVQVSVK